MISTDIIITGIAIFMFLVVTYFATVNIKESAVENFKTKAIENNCGQFNNKTGEFEWIKK